VEGGAPAIRASDADRDRTVAILHEAHVRGRLGFEELSERLDAALAAVDRAELERLTRDIFGDEPYTLPIGLRGPAPTRWTVSVMSGVKRRIRLIHVRTRALALGGCELDLRDAELRGDAELVAIAVMGGIDVIVPEGVDVDLGGFAFMGGKEDRSRADRVLPGAPRLRVRAYAVMGGVRVWSEPHGDSAESAAPPPAG
jgi:hypothetical protein